MCTLALAWRALADAPVAVAANRDEATDRPSEPPARYADDPVVVAPRDAEAGGTWIGVTERGLFAGITNRWSTESLAGERSRGRLVADALACASATDAASLIEAETDDREYDGFYLVVADADDAISFAWDGSLSRTELDPGVHVVVNVGRVGGSELIDVPDHRRALGERQIANARRVRDALEPGPAEGAAAWLERGGTVLGDHEYGVCVHGDGFGTRSSSLLAAGGAIEPIYRFADGPPCRTPYEPVPAIESVESHI